MKSKSILKKSSQDSFFSKTKKTAMKRGSDTQHGKIKSESAAPSENPLSTDSIKKSPKKVSLSFTSASCLDGIKKEPKHIRKMTFAERLKLEQESGDGRQEERRNKFGLREISYSVEDNTVPAKFQKLRQKNDEHIRQRKMLIRTAKKLKRK